LEERGQVKTVAVVGFTIQLNLKLGTIAAVIECDLVAEWVLSNGSDLTSGLLNSLVQLLDELRTGGRFAYAVVGFGDFGKDDLLDGGFELGTVVDHTL